MSLRGWPTICCPDLFTFFFSSLFMAPTFKFKHKFPFLIVGTAIIKGHFTPRVIMQMKG